jgi:hypothetical protein
MLRGSENRSRSDIGRPTPPVGTPLEKAGTEAGNCATALHNTTVSTRTSPAVGPVFQHSGGQFQLHALQYRAAVCCPPMSSGGGGGAVEDHFELFPCYFLPAAHDHASRAGSSPAFEVARPSTSIRLPQQTK